MIFVYICIILYRYIRLYHCIIIYHVITWHRAYGVMPGLRDRRRDHDCALCRSVSKRVELWEICSFQRRYKHWRGKSKFYCAGRCITGGEVCC